MDATYEAERRVYGTGDYVYPTDLPRPHLCRVTEIEEFCIGAGISQLLKLEPIKGPWPEGTRLIRLNTSVVPAGRPGVRAGLARRPGRAKCSSPVRSSARRAAG